MRDTSHIASILFTRALNLRAYASKNLHSKLSDVLLFLTSFCEEGLQPRSRFLSYLSQATERERHLGLACSGVRWTRSPQIRSVCDNNNNNNNNDDDNNNNNNNINNNNNYYYYFNSNDFFNLNEL